MEPSKHDPQTKTVTQLYEAYRRSNRALVAFERKHDGFLIKGSEANRLWRLRCEIVDGRFNTFYAAKKAEIASQKNKKEVSALIRKTRRSFSRKGLEGDEQW